MNRNHVFAVTLSALLLGAVIASYFVAGPVPVTRSGSPTPERAARECALLCASSEAELVEVKYGFESGQLVRHECVCVPIGVAVDPD